MTPAAYRAFSGGPQILAEDDEDVDENVRSRSGNSVRESVGDVAECDVGDVGDRVGEVGDVDAVEAGAGRLGEKSDEVLLFPGLSLDQMNLCGVGVNAKMEEVADAGESGTVALAPGVWKASNEAVGWATTLVASNGVPRAVGTLRLGVPLTAEVLDGSLDTEGTGVNTAELMFSATGGKGLARFSGLNLIAALVGLRDGHSSFSALLLIPRRAFE